jgi:predicted negative regulator of RcsB-dependent stress response
MEKGKISVRRELREPDAFVKTTYTVIDYVKKHSKMFIAGAVLLLVAVITAAGTTWYLNDRREKAELALNQVLANLDKESAETEQLLNRIRTEYRSTPVGPLAGYLEANLKYRQEQLEQAAKLYQENQVSDRYLEDLQRYGLAVVDFRQEKYDSAISILEDLQTRQSFINEDTYILLGLSYEKNNNPEKAVAVYENMIQLLPKSFFRPWAEERLVSLKNRLKS